MHGYLIVVFGIFLSICGCSHKAENRNELFFSEEGILLNEISFNAKGEKDGIAKHYNDQKEMILERTFRSDTLVSETFFQKGVVISRSEMRGENNKYGLYTSFYDEQIVKSRHEYKNNIFHGVCVDYYRNGNVETKGNYIMGIKEGVYTQNYENGMAMIITDSLINGKGWYHFFDSLGTPKGDVLYSKDTILGTELIDSSFFGLYLKPPASAGCVP